MMMMMMSERGAVEGGTVRVPYIYTERRAAVAQVTEYRSSSDRRQIGHARGEQHCAPPLTR